MSFSRYLTHLPDLRANFQYLDVPQHLEVQYSLSFHVISRMNSHFRFPPLMYRDYFSPHFASQNGDLRLRMNYWLLHCYCGCFYSQLNSSQIMVARFLKCFYSLHYLLLKRLLVILVDILQNLNGSKIAQNILLSLICLETFKVSFFT